MRQYSYDGRRLMTIAGPRHGPAARSRPVSASAGCSGADTAPPVATVSFTPSKSRVPLGSPVDFTYRFDVAPGAKIDGDYRVFVHVNRDDGQIDLERRSRSVRADVRSGSRGRRSSTRARGSCRCRRTSAKRRSRSGCTATRSAAASGERPGRSRVARPCLQGRHAAACCRRPRTSSSSTRTAGIPSEFAADEPTLAWQWTQKSAS